MGVLIEGTKDGGGTVTDMVTTDSDIGAWETIVPAGDFTGLTSLWVFMYGSKIDNILLGVPAVLPTEQSTWDT